MDQYYFVEVNCLLLLVALFNYSLWTISINSPGFGPGRVRPWAGLVLVWYLVLVWKRFTSPPYPSSLGIRCRNCNCQKLQWGPPEDKVVWMIVSMRVGWQSLTCIYIYTHILIFTCIRYVDIRYLFIFILSRLHHIQRALPLWQCCSAKQFCTVLCNNKK